jgi:hypothetical protein
MDNWTAVEIKATRSVSLREECHSRGCESATYVVVLITNEPSPARAEVVDGGIGELLLELVEGTEGLVDGISNLASGGSATVGLQAVPVEGVVPDLYHEKNKMSVCVLATRSHERKKS